MLKIVIGVVIAVVCLAGVLVARVWLTPEPKGLGVRDGRLADCPSSPNCVCSQSGDAEHQVAPLTFTGPPGAAMDRLEKLVRSMPRTEVVRRDGDYMHVVFRSFLFRFPDDVEFYAQPASAEEPGRIDVRSASRIGYSDLGVNRARVEEITRCWQEESSPTTN